jgi:polysaccharide export outer membrane protein
MKLFIAVLLLAACCGLSPLICAQQQQTQSGAGGQAQSGTAQTSQGASASLDNQGIQKYVLGPGDTLDVRVFGQPDFNSIAEVDSDGNVSSLPFLEKPIRASCRTERDVQNDITTAYTKFLKNPQVSVRVTGRNSRPPAIVHGAVNVPQRIQMQRRVRLNDILAVAGGITERSNGTIQVLHTEAVMCPEPGEVIEPEPTIEASNGAKIPTFKLYKIADILAGKEEANPIIRPGDIVRALEAEPVYVTGSVISPQGIYLRDQLTLSRALAMVGGTRKEAKMTDVRIYRQKPGSTEQELIKVDYQAIKKRQKEDVLLKAYDVIEVPEASALSKGRIGQTLFTGVLGGFNSAVSNIGGALPLRVLY